VEVEMTLMLTEAGPDLPGEQERKVVVLTATAFVDTPDEVAGELAGLRTPPIPRLAEREEPSPYDVLFHDFGGRWREGSRFASDNVWTDGDLTDALLPLRTSLLEAPSPSSFAFAVMAPDPPEDEAEEELPDMAFSMYARTFVACYAMWDDAEDDAANLEWLPTAMAALEPGSAGHYVAEADLTAAAPRTARSYAAPAWDRLQDLQRRLDPDGRFPGYLGPEDRGTAAP
jgi:FAD/FMN-containing dehydrogenase